MNRLAHSALAAGLLVSFGCFAAPPSGAPAGSTALCKDGTYYSGAEKKGACSGHKGIKEWWGDGAAAPKADGKGEKKAEARSSAAKQPVAAPATKAGSTAPAVAPGKTEAPKPMPAPGKAEVPAAVPAPSSAAAPSKPEPPKPAQVAAPGGGAGKVWANESTKVYHCPGDRWYGKTKQGEYMTEAQAQAKGLKPDHGKACQ